MKGKRSRAVAAVGGGEGGVGGDRLVQVAKAKAKCNVGPPVGADFRSVRGRGDILTGTTLRELFCFRSFTSMTCDLTAIYYRQPFIMNAEFSLFSNVVEVCLSCLLVQKPSEYASHLIHTLSVVLGFGLFCLKFCQLHFPWFFQFCFKETSDFRVHN
jgi:hypothetical protein